MPLALELAAARARVLTPDQILERLSERLDLFRGGRDADPRQQSLRATIEWSHDLLDPEEQELFARLAVFRGGCTLEVAEQVAGAAMDTLQSLVEKSLVRRTGERFWMLETIREFPSERFDDEDVRRCHEHYLVVAERANLSLMEMGRGPMRHDLVLPEQENIGGRHRVGDAGGRRARPPAAEMDDRNRTLWALAALAWAAAERGERERATSLWATVENEKRDPGRFAKFAPDLYRPKIPDVVQLGAAPSLEDAVRLGLDSLD